MSKLFKQSEINEAAFKYNPVQKLDCEFIRSGFKAGVEFSESKLEEMAIEFANYLEDLMGEFNLYDNIDKIPTKLSNSDLFQDFLKQRNNE